MSCSMMRKKFATMSRADLLKFAKIHGLDTSLSTNELRRLLEELHDERELDNGTKTDAVSKQRIAVPTG